MVSSVGIIKYKNILSGFVQVKGYMDERSEDNLIDFIGEEGRIEFNIKEIHNEIDFEKLPIISCFELSTMLSGKWVTKMFDTEDKIKETLSIPTKSKFTILAHESALDFVKKFSEFLVKHTKAVKYNQLDNGKVRLLQ